MSGVEVLSFLLDLPSYIDNFVKTCRAVKEFKEIDDTHKELLQRVIHNSNRLKHLTGLIRDPSVYTKETQEYISQLMRQSKLSMERTSRIVNNWKQQLGIKDGITGPRTKRLIPSLMSCFGKKSTESEEEVVSYMHERKAEAEYLIFGKLEIESCMESLEHYLTDLNFAILTSDRLLVSPDSARGTTDNIEFVVCAKRRIESQFTINCIDSSVLGPLSDIDSEMATGIFRVDSGEFAGCIVDPRNVWQYADNQRGDIAWEETKNIARLFAEDTNASESLYSSVGILPSCGYSELDTHIHAIVFRLPPNTAPLRTLRSLLVEGKLKHSLRDRVDFAIKLATCVLVVHSLGLVHKSIRPDSIIMTESNFGEAKKLYPYKLGVPYLLAFDSSRSSKGTTMKHPYSGPEGALWQTLYKHPRHVGSRQYKYEMRDDIYSLGVCLFEVALWKSLFRWKACAEARFEGDKDILDLSDSTCKAKALALGRPRNTNLMWVRQHLLVEAAEEFIPPIMGDLFKDVVIACLTFGDSSKVTKSETFQLNVEDNSDLPPDEQSIHFVRDILKNLRSIRLS